MSNHIDGRNVLIKYNGQNIAYVKSLGIQLTRTLIATNSPTSKESTEYVAGKESWTASARGLVPSDVSALNAMYASRTPMPIETTIGNIIYTGNAIVKSMSIDGNVGSLASYSVTLQGSGKLNSTET